MSRPNSPRPDMGGWKYLCRNVQLMVLEEMAKTPRLEGSNRSGVAQYACVCRDWQLFFEKRNFRNLLLKRPDLPSLKRIVSDEHRRGFVKHIALRVKVGPDGYGSVERPEDIQQRDAWELSHATWDLWTVLSTWGKRDVSRHEHLTLELLAETATPPQYFNLGEAFSRKIEHYSSYLRDRSLQAYRLCSDEHSQSMREFRSHIRDGGYPGLWDLFKQRILEEGNLNINFDFASPRTRQVLPRVEVVTEFLVRREYYQNFDPRALSMIVECLPRLEYINIERWAYIDNDEEKRWNEQSLESLLPMLHRPSSQSINSTSPLGVGGGPSGSLKHLTLFSSARESFQKQSAMPVRNPAMAKSLASLSQDLQHLAVSFLIDAEDFFLPFLSGPTGGHGDEGLGTAGSRLEREPRWEHLSSLALTAKIFTTSEASEPLDTARVNRLLLAAAAAAKGMPNLQVMEIWNADKGQATIFRYVSTRDITEIVWQGTKRQELSEEVLEAWREVALRNAKREPLLREVAIKPESIEGNPCVLSHLRLGKQVIHEVSAWQAQWEQRYRF